MSYVGNVPTTAAFPFDQFSGNGSTTAFTLSYAPAGTTSIIVSISGVVQNPNTYSVSGTTLTFTPAPPTGTNNIAVLYLGLPVVASMTGTMGFIAGSATNPPIFPIGDTNTGIFFPAADTIAFAEGGAEVARFDSAGNVGIGTSSPSAKLHVSGISSNNSNIRLTNTFTGGRSWELNPYASGVSDIPFTIRDVTAGADRVGIDSSGNFQFNSGYGSVATAYGCRAWVNFNGTGTVAIRASGNVSSITDNNTGDYTVNFTTAMPDANYSAVCMQNNYLYTASTRTIIIGSGAQTDQATSSFRLYSGTLSNGTSNGSAADSEVIRVAIFR